MIVILEEFDGTSFLGNRLKFFNIHVTEFFLSTYMYQYCQGKKNTCLTFTVLNPVLPSRSAFYVNPKYGRFNKKFHFMENEQTNNANESTVQQLSFEKS